MAIIKNIKGHLIDVEPLVCGTVSYFRNKLNTELKEKEHVSMATATAYFMAKQNLLPKFTPFDCSLKKIYGNDFFDDTHDDTFVVDGCPLFLNAKVSHGDTDGDI